MNVICINKLRKEIEKYPEKSFEKEMKKMIFQGFHFTNVIDINDIINKGIQPLSKENIEKIKNNLKRKYIRETNYIEERFKEFENEEFEEKNNGRVSFSATKKLCFVEGLLDYCGGEALAGYFNRKKTEIDKKNNIDYDKILNMLSDIGKPYIIVFDFYYDELEDEFKTKLNNALMEIKTQNKKIIESIKNTLRVLELRIEKSIPANRIRGYYPYDKNNHKTGKYKKIR